MPTPSLAFLLSENQKKERKKARPFDEVRALSCVHDFLSISSLTPQSETRKSINDYF